MKNINSRDNYHSFIKSKKSIFDYSIVVLFIVFVSSSLNATVGISTPSLAINTCSFPSAESILGDIVITEGANGEFGNGTFTITIGMPANFIINTATAPTLSYIAGRNITATPTITAISATSLTIQYITNAINKIDAITISGLRIIATTSPSTGSITKTGGTVPIGTFANGTPLASLSSTVSCVCTHTLRLTDTFGDGWNGGTVNVSVNGVDVLTNAGGTFTTGFGPVDLVFMAATGDVIRVYETAGGGFPTEMRVQIFDGGMTSIIAQQDPTVGTPTTGGSIGNGNCPPPMAITAATVVQSSAANTTRCGANQQIVCLQITTTGATTPITLTQIQTNFDGTAGVSALSNADIYYTGTSSTFSTTTLFGSNASPSTTTYNINGSQVLTTGVNYFWLVYDLNNTGTLGSTIDGLITQFTASSVNYNSGSTPSISTTNPAGTSSLIICTSPGGVAGVTLWLKADAGTNTTTNATLVNSWASQASSIACTLTQATGANQPLYRDGSGTGALNRFNYNPGIYTDGTQNYLRANGNFDFCNIATAVSVYQAIGTDNGVCSMNWSMAGRGEIKLKQDGPLYIINQGELPGGTAQNVVTCPSSVQATIHSVRGNGFDIRPSANPLFGGRRDAVVSAAYGHGYFVAPSSGIVVGGNLDVSSGEFMQGGQGEYIIFPTVLTDDENLRVESYMAIKYGVTLGSPSILSNYLSSTSTIIWNSTLPNSNLYQNKIIGIARDDNSGLLQKQSHQYDDTVRIYKGTLSSTNQANVATFDQDRSFVIMGSNTGKLCLTAASLAEMPVGLTNCLLYSRLEREWKVQRTNMAETYNMDVKLATCANPTLVNTAHLRFLVDDDGNFANGGTQCYYNGDGTGIVISYSNPTITVTGITTTHIPNNGTKYITIASIDVITPLPVELLHFDAKKGSGRTVDVTWTTATEINNDYFIVEKSIDGTSWSQIGTVAGAGNSTETLDYYLEDVQPVLGNNYYRLKQVDFDGQIKTSEIRMVPFNNFESTIVYPNPATNSLFIVKENLNQNQIDLINEMGQVVQVGIISLGDNVIELDVSTISRGFYFVRITGSQGVELQKVIIE